MVSRNRIVAVTRSWIGTSYHHQASVKRAGCDCLGLLMGVFAEVVKAPMDKPPPYSKTWADVASSDILIDACRKHLVEIDKGSIDEGDVLIFRLSRNYAAKHAGIMTGIRSMVHAQEGIGVHETTLGPWWFKRIAASFQFPNVDGR